MQQLQRNSIIGSYDTASELGKHERYFRNGKILFGAVINVIHSDAYEFADVATIQRRKNTLNIATEDYVLGNFRQLCVWRG